VHGMIDGAFYIANTINFLGMDWEEACF